MARSPNAGSSRPLRPIALHHPDVGPLTAFGLFAVAAMVVCYAFERRGRLFVLGFAASCVLASAYGFLQGAWPFGLVEAIWSLVALRRWWLA